MNDVNLKLSDAIKYEEKLTFNFLVIYANKKLSFHLIISSELYKTKQTIKQVANDGLN